MKVRKARTLCHRFDPCAACSSGWKLSNDWSVKASGSHANGPVNNIKQRSGFWNSGKYGCKSDAWVAWDLKAAHSVDGIRYAGANAVETLRAFTVYFSTKSINGPWEKAFSTSAGKAQTAAQTFMFAGKRARYWKIDKLESHRSHKNCELLAYVEWHFTCPAGR